MLIDTHCHIDARPEFDGIVIAASAHPDDFAKNIALADAHENIFCTIGIHPEYAGEKIKFPDLAHPKIVGVGEIGLDYHYGTDNRAPQIELFEAQLHIARRAGLPVAIHSRDAAGDTLEILKKWGGGGVLHSFAYDYEFAKKLLDYGWCFSANGIITFKNGQNLRDAFAQIPIDRIVIETDAPYLAPVPYRGKTCEPLMVAETARALAALKNIALPELEAILEENTKNLYPKLKCQGKL